MQPGKTFLSTIAGTSAMTLFSYLISEANDENYKEPEVLGQLIKRLPDGPSNEKARIAGWGGHYAAGLAFELIFNEVWEREWMKPSIASGALMGVTSGVAGIVAWKVAFDAHPNPPVKNLKKYFAHLMLAHVVFGVSSALTYKLLAAKNNN